MSARDRVTYVCPVLHAERLHEAAPWAAVRGLLDAVERGGGRMTLFVSPFWPHVHGIDIAGRLAEVAERGHEVAQHTHYYDWDGEAPDRYRKRTDLSDDNVRRCLDRDHGLLCEAGFAPRGFTSGGWKNPPALASWLSGHQFAYDCSRRSYVGGDPSRAAGSAGAGDNVVDLPTTHSLRAAVRARGIGRLVGEAGVIVYYAHDYDLLSPTRRLAMAAVARWRPSSARCERVDTVVRLISGPPPDPSRR